MTSDSRMPLREAAERLAGYNRFRESRTGGKRELLKLLQTEQIQAAFDFPSNERPRIDIPAQYWRDTLSGDFLAQLTSRSKHGKQGQYLLEPTQFIEQYKVWYARRYVPAEGPRLHTSEAVDEFASALAGINSKREAYILEPEWERFVQVSRLDEHRVSQIPVKSDRGVKPLRSWDIVCVELAVELLDRWKRGIALDEYTDIAKSALRRAAEKLATGNPAPSVDTVARKVSEIVERVNQATDGN